MYLCISLTSEWVARQRSPTYTYSITLPICIPAFAFRVNKFKYAILKQRSSAPGIIKYVLLVELENQSLENQIKDEKLLPLV